MLTAPDRTYYPPPSWNDNPVGDYDTELFIGWANEVWSGTMSQTNSGRVFILDLDFGNQFDLYFESGCSAWTDRDGNVSAPVS